MNPRTIDLLKDERLDGPLVIATDPWGTDGIVGVVVADDAGTYLGCLTCADEIDRTQGGRCAACRDDMAWYEAMDRPSAATATRPRDHTNRVPTLTTAEQTVLVMAVRKLRTVQAGLEEIRRLRLTMGSQNSADVAEKIRKSLDAIDSVLRPNGISL